MEVLWLWSTGHGSWSDLIWRCPWSASRAAEVSPLHREVVPFCPTSAYIFIVSPISPSVQSWITCRKFYQIYCWTMPFFRVHMCALLQPGPFVPFHCTLMSHWFMEHPKSAFFLCLLPHLWLQCLPIFSPTSVPERDHVWPPIHQSDSKVHFTCLIKLQTTTQEMNISY